MSTYAFTDTAVSLVGLGAVLQLGSGNGVAEEGITIKREGDKNKMTLGADGTGMHSLVAASAGTIEITLLKTSPSNAALMELYNVQRVTAALWGSNVITITQSGLGDLHVCTQCAFKKAPDIGYAVEGKTVTWVFDSVLINNKLGALGA